MNTKDKLLEWLRGERCWDQQAMARECLDAIEQAYRDGVSDGFAAGKDAVPAHEWYP